MAATKQPAVFKPTKYDPRFDYVDKLPRGVPPIELAMGSMSRVGQIFLGPAHQYYYPSGPAEATYYFPVQVMPNEKNATGVFFPSGFSFPEKINVILYFHGHKAKEFTTINEYWSGNLHNINLREDINATGKQAVLIAPTMGRAAGSGLNSDMGIFAKPGGADVFLDDVVEWIGKYVPEYVLKKVTPEIGNIILAGHSGAGGILSQQIQTMKSPVREVWGFDTMYGQGYRTHRVNGRQQTEAIDVAGDWLETAFQHNVFEFEKVSKWLPIPIPRPKPTAQFYFYWVTPTDPVSKRTLNLQERVWKMGLHNVTVIESATVDGGKKYSWENHFGTVTANFRARVAASNNL